MALEQQALMESSRQMLANGSDMESVLALLRQAGCSKIESIRAVMELRDTTLGEAKRIVHLSQVWRDTLESDDQLHELLQTAAQALADNTDGSLNHASAAAPPTDSRRAN